MALTVKAWAVRRGRGSSSRRAAPLVLLAATGLLAGCGTVFGGMDLAPSGLPRAEEDLRGLLAGGKAATAYDRVTGEESPAPDDDVLRLLYAGTAAYYAGHYEEGGRFLDLAAGIADDRATRSVSREALSFMTNDRVLPYMPPRTERLMLHVYGALTFLGGGQPYEAAVEARRISALLDGWQDGAPDDVPRTDRFFRYFAGAVFEAAGEYNDAGVAYRRAGTLEGDLLAPPGDSAEIVVVVERGFVAHRVEQNVIIAIPGGHVASLTDGGVGERLLSATQVSLAVLAIAAYQGQQVRYTGDGYRRPLQFDPWGDDCRHAGWDATCENDENPYLLRIAWPVYRSDGARPETAALAGSPPLVALQSLDVSDAVVADFDATRAELIARTVARAATKLVVTKTVERKVGEREKVAGQILGILANIGTLVTERADTRSWHLLPGHLTMLRVRVPPGQHSLSLKVGDRVVDLDPVTVRPGRVAVVAHRAWTLLQLSTQVLLRFQLWIPLKI